MKKVNCYDCAVSFKSETRDNVLQQLYEHYMKEHYLIITSGSEEEKKAWMDRFDKDWESAEEC